MRKIIFIFLIFSFLALSTENEMIKEFVRGFGEQLGINTKECENFFSTDFSNGMKKIAKLASFQDNESIQAHLNTLKKEIVNNCSNFVYYFTLFYALNKSKLENVEINSLIIKSLTDILKIFEKEYNNQVSTPYSVGVEFGKIFNLLVSKL